MPTSSVPPPRRPAVLYAAPTTHLELTLTPKALQVPMQRTLMACPVCAFAETHLLPIATGKAAKILTGRPIATPAPACKRCANAFRRFEGLERQNVEILTSFPPLLERDDVLRAQHTDRSPIQNLGILAEVCGSTMALCSKHGPPTPAAECECPVSLPPEEVVPSTTK